ncbi:hypothetical protein F6Y05_23645 [Bacillus megaterium]|nr:hypothetical protein [Priestia megaterium]
MNERFDGVDGRTTNTQAEANVSAFFCQSLISMSHRYKDNGTIVCIFKKERELHEIAYSKTFNFI